MTTPEATENRGQSQEKGTPCPYMELLDKLIEDSRQEMFEKNINTIEPESD